MALLSSYLPRINEKGTNNDSSAKISGLWQAAILRVGLGLPIIALIVILPAGRWDYWQGWMYIATVFIPMLIVFPYLLINDPALLERRMRMREKEAAQRKIIRLSYIYFLVAFILPGLDVRFGWSNVPPLYPSSPMRSFSPGT